MQHRAVKVIHVVNCRIYTDFSGKSGPMVNGGGGGMEFHGFMPRNGRVVQAKLHNPLFFLCREPLFVLWEERFGPPR